MQWRRRHCCAHIVKALSVLGVLVFLVHQVWQPRLTGMPWWKGHPVVFGGDGLQISKPTVNSSSKDVIWKSVIVPQETVKTDSNVSRENEDIKIDLIQKNTTSNSSQNTERNARSAGNGFFPYIINEPDKCAKLNSPFLVLLVTTEARKVEARNAIRETWGRQSAFQGLRVIRLFLLGKTEGELGLIQQKTLATESQRHHDIIQQDFMDTYKNLTIKTMMGMKWVATFCPRASYVMKTDSDMFVNTEYLIYKLLRPDLTPKKNFFTGNNMRNFSPNRNQDSKWYMPRELYPNPRYPPFCSGTGYVFSGDLAMKIYQVSLTVPYLHLEDVYVGVCLAKLQIEPTPPPNEFLFNHWRVSYSSCRYSHLITSHGFNPNELLKYWHHLQNNKHKACLYLYNKKA